MVLGVVGLDTVVDQRRKEDAVGIDLFDRITWLRALATFDVRIR
jgi:hypothetical protein